MYQIDEEFDAGLHPMCGECRHFRFACEAQRKSYYVEQPGICRLFGLRGDGRDWCEGCKGFKALKKGVGRARGNMKSFYAW